MAMALGMAMALAMAMAMAMALALGMAPGMAMAMATALALAMAPGMAIVLALAMAMAMAMVLALAMALFNKQNEVKMLAINETTHEYIDLEELSNQFASVFLPMTGEAAFLLMLRKKMMPTAGILKQYSGVWAHQLIFTEIRESFRNIHEYREITHEIVALARQSVRGNGIAGCMI